VYERVRSTSIDNELHHEEELRMADEPNDKLLKMIEAMGEAMRSDFAAHCQKMDEKYNALADSIGKKKDAAGEGPSRGEDDMGDGEDDMTRRGAATRVAADSADNAHDIRVLRAQLADLQKKQTREMGTMDKFADEQAKADAVMRMHGSGAEPPMVGEDLVAYQIRLARKMQPHSKTWRGVELAAIAADKRALGIALDGIRADAMHAALHPVDLPEFQHRKITKTLPGGHQVTEFVGSGTIFKMLSRPVRHVVSIGPRWAGAGA
jgi:hypothetical protein